MIEALLSAGKAKGPPPGPTDIAVGDEQLGYYGLVLATDFITGTSLASAVTLTAGTAINSTVDWFKFAYKGKTLYIPQKPLRYALSWNQLNALGIVTGTKTVGINGNAFKVRLMSGSLLNPYRGLNDASDDPRTVGSEYNDLIYRVCVTNPPSETSPSFASFTQAELGSVGNGAVQWCQEQSIPTNGPAGVVCRCNATNDFATLHGPTAGFVDNFRGWRPVLELIG